MFYEMTAQDVKPDLLPFQDIFVSGSRDEIRMSEIFERWFLSFIGQSFEKPLFAIPNLLPILQIDYSSIYGFLEFRSETALLEESFRKIKQIKVLEDVFGMLNELTSEQIEVFEEEVKRRSFF